MDATFVRLRSAAVVIAASLAVAIPAAADTGPDAPTPPTLSGTSWRFVEILGAAPLANLETALDFAADGAVTGLSGCNSFVGRYTAGGDGLSFSDIGYTKMWCGPDVMTTELAVQKVLRRTSAMAITPVELDLRDPDGVVLARLAPATTTSAPPAASH